MPRKQNSKPKPKSTSTKKQVKKANIQKKIKDSETPFYLENRFDVARSLLTYDQNELLQFVLDSLDPGLVTSKLDLGDVAKASNTNIGVVKARLRKIRNEWLIMFNELKGAGEITTIHVTDPKDLHNSSPVFREKYVT